jgi:methyl-accepting chemotaxis protein
MEVIAMLTNLNISTRLGAGFSAILIFMAIIIAMGSSRLIAIGHANNKLMTEQVVVTAANSVETFALDAAVRTLALLTLTERDARVNSYKRIDADTKMMDDALATLARLMTSPEEKAILGKVQTARTVYTASFLKVAEMIESGEADDAATLMNDETSRLLDSLLGQIGLLTDMQKKKLADSAAEVKSDIDTARMWMILLGVVALLASIGLAYVISRSITRPLNHAVKVAQTVATGDLTSRIDAHGNDETGKLLQALKNMNQNLSRIVGQVRLGTEAIATASNQIVSGNLDLSNRTESQASSLEETASSMEELNSTVKQNVDYARQANQLVISASDVAMKGGDVVNRVVTTMSSIKASSSKIVDIIGVIDGIAFQTNILALNAAVEAARAGEQGRGFAVVAAEVRSLAQRSASAAKEIKRLIGDSVEKVDSGASLVDQAGATMDDIVSSVKQVADIMGEITSASREQSAGIDQVNQAIGQIDEMTQQNAALVEQATAAAESLKNQASILLQGVSAFKLAQGAALPAERSKPAAQDRKAIPAARLAAPAPKQISTK